MKALFEPEFFAANRRRLLAALVGDKDNGMPVILTANGLLQRNSDVTYRYRQDSSFWYLTGVADPDVIVVFDDKEEYLIVPTRDVVRQAFDGAVLAEELTAQSGIETVLDEEDGWQRLGETLKSVKRFATLDATEPYIAWHGLYVNPARGRLIERLRNANPEAELVDARGALAIMRCIKQPVELEAIQRAIDITIAGMEQVTAQKQLQTYSHEYEIEADLTQAFRRQNADHSFNPIVAAGQHTCQLHHVANNGAIQKNDLLVLDIGAESNMYAADITRTVVCGEPSERQQAVYDAVCAVQDFALQQLKPGVLPKEYEDAVENYLGEQLVKLGLIDKVEHEQVRKYYPHAASHFLGLDVHDVGDYKQPLEAGMVVTCEPGIYIPEEGLGVRIEDDVLITTDGNKVLTAKLPRQLRIDA